MDHQEQGNTSGALQPDYLRQFEISSPVPVMVEELLLPTQWKMTTSVRVGKIIEKWNNGHSMRVTHSGMVKAVDPLPAAS